MDDVTKAFLDKCAESKVNIEQSTSDVSSEFYTAPSMSKLDVEEIFEAAGGSGTTTAAIRIGISAISA